MSWERWREEKAKTQQKNIVTAAKQSMAKANVLKACFRFPKKMGIPTFALATNIRPKMAMEEGV